MGATVVALTVSLDGYIAGPNDGPEHPLGVGGKPLFDWMGGSKDFVIPERSRPVVDGWRDCTGAIVSGRRTFDIANGWKDGHPIDAPIFVLTHEPPTAGEWSPRVEFVTDLDEALARARAAAGERDVAVGAASVVQQVLRAGQLDEIELSVVPYLLGSGVRLLDGIGPLHLEQRWAIESDGVTHLRYRVVR